MVNQAWKKGRILLTSMIGVLALTMLTLWGCGGGGYDDPVADGVNAAVTTKTETALITAGKLREWMDAGLVNKAGGYDRVVILDISNNPGATPNDNTTNVYYTTGHIPGAQLIAGANAANAFQDYTRAEGPLNVTGNMVCTGATIDSIIQNAGIDQYTTIVLTTNGTSALNLTRAYATFRYWGIPKNRLKVLQGGNAAWVTAGNTLTKALPSITKSTYGVALNGTTTINTDMRVSLSEMISYVRGIVDGNAGKVYVLDTVRGANQVTTTTDLIDTGYTPFEGAIKGSYRFPLSNVITGVTFVDDPATIKGFISAAVGTDNVETIGDTKRDAAKTFITMCRAGNNASQAYFVLDGIAYYNSTVDIKWYDGSYGQWNLMASSDHLANNGSNAGGKLNVGSIWDTTSLMDNLQWNVDNSRAIVNYADRVYTIEPSFADGNQVETTDRAYRTPAPGTGSGGSSSGGGNC